MSPDFLNFLKLSLYSVHTVEKEVSELYQTGPPPKLLKQFGVLGNCHLTMLREAARISLTPA